MEIAYLLSQHQAQTSNMFPSAKLISPFPCFFPASSDLSGPSISFSPFVNPGGDQHGAFGWFDSRMYPQLPLYNSFGTQNPSYMFQSLSPELWLQLELLRKKVSFESSFGFEAGANSSIEPVCNKRKGCTSSSSEDSSTVSSVVEGGNNSPEVKKQKTADVVSRFELPFVLPKCILQELDKTNAKGEFTTAEILIMLLVAHEVFFQNNVYSVIRTVMNSERSRASIRRKIEKLVAQDGGQFGGLLKYELRISTRKILRVRCLSYLDKCKTSSDESLRELSKQVEEFISTTGILKE